MDTASNLPALVCGLAFVLAVVFGAVANRVNFCTMGAVADIVNFGDWRRMRMWLLAIAVAILGAGALQAAGLVDLTKSFYTGKTISWLSLLVGGFLFGFGMTLGSGCGSKTLIRIGGGNLKSLVVLVFLGDLGVHDAARRVRAVARQRARSAALRRRRPRRRRVGPADDRDRAGRRRRGEAMACRSSSRSRWRRTCSPTASSARRAR